MNPEQISKYGQYFKKLRRANGNAPHKPILLLSVFQAVQSQLITSPFFEPLPELVSLFKNNWGLYVTTAHNPVFTMPFTKMNSEPFWEIIFKPEFTEVNFRQIDIKSFAVMINLIEGAKIDSDLFFLLQDKETNDFFCRYIVELYFPEATYKRYSGGYGTDFEENKRQILEEKPAEYIRETRQLVESENTDEIAVRSAVFKRVIPQQYSYTCAVTGWRATTIHNASLIDACHIVPFSESYDDTIGNGIALSPSIHRAFDRGLLSIDEDYKVVISKSLRENDTPFSLKNLEGRQILLPEDRAFWPDKENLRKHRAMLR